MSAATIALVGRPNSGKSSLYNALTGKNARVANFPGVTVDVLESDLELPSGVVAKVADLPGFYSLAANVGPDTDEGIARTYLERLRAERSPYVVVQVVDPTRLELGLRLTKELVAAKVPLVVTLTHEDVLAAEGRAVDVSGLSERIGAPVVLVDARKPHAKEAVLAACADRLRAGEAEKTSFDPSAVAKSVVRDVADERARSRRRMTERLDAVLLHPVVGPFVFVGIMAALFASVFLVADPASSAMDQGVALARAGVLRLLGDGLLGRFVGEGVLGGAGAVLAFLPQIVILTVALELLEASGYLARGAFLVDRLLRVLGLGGRSFLPLLMGHACAVPAIGATRIVRDPRERLTTILVLPLMTCSARLPTYALVLSTFLSHRSVSFRAFVFVGLYFAGIFAGLVASWVMRRTVTKGKSLPLVLEMPSYRVPIPRVIATKTWRTAKRFVRDVGTTIVTVASILWILLVVPMPGSTAEGPPIERSIAASVGRVIEPVTKHAGFDWRINVGLVGSFGARELMVGTMGVVFGVENAEEDPAPLTERLRETKKPDGSPVYTTRAGLALLAFFVLACQCMSTVAAIRRETKSWKWPAFVLGYTYAAGWIAAVLTYQLSGLFGVG